MRPWACLLVALLTAAPLPAAHADGQKLPNILWLTTEDMGPQLGCYGDPNAHTPNLDKLAARGMRYARCWSNAPVCAPARATIISGVYPTSTGSQHMRSEVSVPPSLKPYPLLLREAGYYCTNHTKTDYNIAYGRIWDDSSRNAHYKNRKPGQPFFAVFNDVGTHESQIRTRPHTQVHAPAKMRLPAYHPDTPEVRQDWAQYYDNITDMDARMGRLLDELASEGLADDTIVFFYGDHGSGMPRSKRWPYNSGLHVALIVHVPEKWKHLAPPEYRADGVSERLVSFVDLAPTLVSLAGHKPPAWLHGRAFMGAHTAEAPRYLFGFRGRMDERIDCVRSVTDGRFVYVRNFMPHVIYGQYLAYMFQTPTTRVWKQVFDEGRATAAQAAFWKLKPAEELYDLRTDGDEVNNLAAVPDYRTKRDELRAALRAHMIQTRDVGILPEAEMHRLAGDGTIYELAQDPGRYRVEQVLATAELASGMSPQAQRELVAALGEGDSGVRYWGAMGLLMRGESAVGPAAAELRKALEDPSPSVAIVAAEALGRYGDRADLTRSLESLKRVVSPAATDAYTAIAALNAIDALGQKGRALDMFLRTMPSQDPDAPPRANDYVVRLLKERFGDEFTPADLPAGKARPKRR